MSEILAPLVRASLAFSGGLALATLLRVPLRRFAGAQAAYSLWLLAPLAGLATLAPASSVLSLLPPPAAPSLASESVTLIVGTTTTVSLAPSLGQQMLHLAPAFWLAGAALSLGLLVLRQVVYARRELGPAVVGALAPRIVLPPDFAQRYTAPEQALVLAHEREHLRALHPQTNLLACALLCLQWFNPLAYLALRLMRIDQELACDAAVMRRHPDGWRAYGEAMLKTNASSPWAPAVCGWPTETLIKERFSMLTFKPSRSRVALAACGMGGLFAAAAFAAYAAQPAAIPPATPPAPIPTAAIAAPAIPTPPQPSVSPRPPRPRVLTLSPAPARLADHALTSRASPAPMNSEEIAGLTTAPRPAVAVRPVATTRASRPSVAALSASPAPVERAPTITTTTGPDGRVTTTTVRASSITATTDIQVGQPAADGRYPVTIHGDGGQPVVVNVAKGQTTDITLDGQPAKVMLAAGSGAPDAVSVLVTRPGGSITMSLLPGTRGSVSRSSSSSASASATPGP